MNDELVKLPVSDDLCLLLPFKLWHYLGPRFSFNFNIEDMFHDALAKELCRKTDTDLRLIVFKSEYLR